MKTILKLLYIIGFLKLISSFFFDEYVPHYLKTGVFSACILLGIILLEFLIRKKHYDK